MVKKITIISNKKINNYKGKQILTPEMHLKYIDKNRFMNEYTKFIGELNKKYKSVAWWACSIGSKNQYSSTLYRNICYYIEIVERIKSSNKDNIFVVAEEKFLIKQLKVYCKQHKIKCIVLNKFKKTCIDLLKFFIITSIKSLVTIYQESIKRYTTKKILGKQIKKQLMQKKNYILQTYVYDKSFGINDQYTDIFYGQLVDYVKKRKNLIIFCRILGSFKKTLIKIKKSLTVMIPLPFFVTYIDHFKIFFLQLKIFFNIKKQISSTITFNNYNIYFLIKQEIFNDLMNGEYRNNLFYYYASKNLCKTIDCEFHTFLYENQSWEKLTIHAIHAYSPHTKIIGYQHSSISKMIFGYFLYKDEFYEIPHPDKIITVGKETKNIMENYGNFPSDFIYEGCALRYNYSLKGKIMTYKKKKKLFIPLPRGTNESLAIIHILLRDLGTTPLFSVQIKSHPDTKIEQILLKKKIILPNHFTIIKNKNIKCILDDADIVLCSDTTVSIESLMIGVPVIFINVNNYYNQDRLFECDHLKWIVNKEDNLVQAISNIYDINDKKFKEQQNLAKEYVKNYFYHVSDERMKEFIK